jgi:hypothetical protein
MTTWQAFVMALIMQESGGNNLAIGDNGAAHGPLQIHRCCVDDVNKYRKAQGWKQYKFPSDCYDRKKAESILATYLHLYANKERLGREPTVEDYARIWNGGPNGYKRKATVKYWVKLKNNHSNP